MRRPPPFPVFYAPRRGEVNYLMERGIPFYLCSIEEFAQLERLAQERGTVPEHMRGTFSVNGGLEFVDKTRAPGAFGPATTRDREDNPLVQHEYDQIIADEESDNQRCETLCDIVRMSVTIGLVL